MLISNSWNFPKFPLIYKQRKIAEKKMHHEKKQNDVTILLVFTVKQ